MTTTPEIPSLTRGAAKALYTDDRTQIQGDPLLQVINIKTVQNFGVNRHRVILSDGEYYLQAMLASQHAPLVDSGQLIKHSIVRVKESISNDLKGRIIVIILNLEVVMKDVAERIGSPMSLDKVNDNAAASSSVSSSPPVAASAGTTHNRPNASVQSTPSTSISTARSHMQDNYTLPIAGLNPYQNRWTIKARVSQKSEVRHWHNARSDGRFFSINLLDQSGEIKATAYHDQVDRLYNVFEEGKVYYISRARVTMARKQFSTLDNEYELSLEAGTEVELCNEDVAIPKMKFNFVRISELENYAKDSLIDCICVVKDDSGLQEIIAKSSGKPMKKRELVCVDDSEKQIRLTLWEKIAEDFDSTGNPVVAFKGLRVSEFNGRSLSLAMGGTLKVNPDIPEAGRLRHWYSTQGDSVSYTSFNQQSNPLGNNVRTEKMTLDRIKEKGVGSTDQAEFFSTRATVVFLKSENPAYPSCPECKKKVLQESEKSWRCERCSKVYPEPVWRYMLTVSIQDATCQLFVQAFDEVGTQLLGKSANEVMHLKDTDADAYSAIMKDSLFKLYNFKGKAKSESYMDMMRTRYTLIDAKPISFSEEANQIADALGKLIA
ncbi:hypothetical protein BX666DRAFT_1968809 [Dichotomocladium elegans]|nr:hypothetical protein BX666DRAFT_1968809 [Dichotomocladium elegans]